MNKPQREYPAAKSLSKLLRRNMTSTEREAWKVLKRLDGLPGHFRRQAPIGPYIADFVCHGLKLIIEIDGGVHAMPGVPERDARRQARLEQRGYTVLRLTDREAASAQILVAKVKAEAARILRPL